MSALESESQKSANDAQISSAKIVRAIDIEISPHADYTTSLGTFKEAGQPKGFCIEFSSDVKGQEFIKTDITARAVPGGFQYLLKVVNDSNKKRSAKVKAL